MSDSCLVYGVISSIRILRSGIIFQLKANGTLFDGLVCFLSKDVYDKELSICNIPLLDQIKENWFVAFKIQNIQQYLTKSSNTFSKKRYHIINTPCMITHPDNNLNIKETLYLLSA
jgi:hypothetical protein